MPWHGDYSCWGQAVSVALHQYHIQWEIRNLQLLWAAVDIVLDVKDWYTVSMKVVDSRNLDIDFVRDSRKSTTMKTNKEINFCYLWLSKIINHQYMTEIVSKRSIILDNQLSRDRCHTAMFFFTIVHTLLKVQNPHYSPK